MLCQIALTWQAGLIAIMGGAYAGGLCYVTHQVGVLRFSQLNAFGVG